MRTKILIITALVAGLAACTGSGSTDARYGLRFEVQPKSTLAGATLPPFSVRLMDLDLGLVDGNRAGTVALSLEDNPSGDPLTLTGTLEVPLVNGEAVFDDVRLGADAIGYRFRARLLDGGAEEVLSTTFTIRPLFEVVGINLAPSSGDVPLNRVLEIEFTATVAANSVDTSSIRIRDLTNTGLVPFGTFLVIGKKVRFEPRLPQLSDLSDAGFQLDTVYSIDIPVLPTGGVKSSEGDSLVLGFNDAFATNETSFLAQPADIGHPDNHADLVKFFTDDENLAIGTDPCARDTLPADDRNSPQVTLLNPLQGATDVGTIAGTVDSTTYVRLPVFTVGFSEPIGPWIVRGSNVTIVNTDTSVEYDAQLSLVQTRQFTQLRITVLDLTIPPPLAIDTVPVGNYEMRLAGVTDLAGNLLVSDACQVDGTFVLAFSTAQPSPP
ncbi:MAG: hypothetical protein ACYTGN_17050 [Planctomycetota bacterium]|jgi:hypothetical protein